jgi:type III restriction enzyme
LSHWFYRDHLVDGRTFKYFFCQREAIETIIYLYEVKKIRTLKELQPFYSERMDKQIALDLFKDSKKEMGDNQKYPKYCFKMATGSGKTKVMSLAIVWAYFNQYAKNFLILAPNVIVFERLCEDFANGKVFLKDPLIPEDLKGDWQLKYILRGDEPSLIRDGSLVLLNIDQIRERQAKEEETKFGRGFLAPVPKQEIELNDETYFKAIKKLNNLLVLNDEAHHVHDEELAWWRKIENIHEGVKQNNKKGLTAQLDFSATPRDRGGVIFPHVVVDYPLADAIENGVVKRVIVGEISNATEERRTTNIAKRYRVWIDAGIARWREYKKVFAKENKKPILFIMTEDTEKADDVVEYLEEIPDLKGKVLCIHTDRFDNISKKEEDKLRQAAREIDTNEYHAIVSVMMLKEGWDVKNVTVIVGLRAFVAEANILPEQTIGRGLRRMDGPGNRDETLDIIGNNNFISIVNELEKEGVAITRKNIDKDHVSDIEIAPDPKRKEHNIKIPLITQRYIPSVDNLKESLQLKDIPKPDKKISLKDKGEVTTITYRGWDAVKLAEAKKQGRKIREEFKREYDFHTVRTAIEATSYFTKCILKNAKLPPAMHFYYLAPLVQDYIQEVLFEERVELDNPEVLNKLNEEDVQGWIFEVFAETIRTAIKTPRPTKIKEERFIDLLKTDSFIWDGNKSYPAKKTIFNLTPFDNNFERDFIVFLDSARDIKSFAKLIHWKTDFRLEYFGVNGGLRHYYPDFVAIGADGTRFLIETKGFVDEDANFKKTRAFEWCRDVSELSGEKWEYLFVPQELFYKDVYKTVAELKKALAEEEDTLFVKEILEEIEKDMEYKEYLPVYSLAAACGKFGEGSDASKEGWIKVDISGSLNEKKKMFVSKVVGHSMEPRIPHNSYCVFRADIVGSRQGKIVLCQHHDITDPETGGSYTVKRYRSEKKFKKDGSWEHEKITLESLNPEYDSIILPKCLEGEFKIIAEFITVI